MILSTIQRSLPDLRKSERRVAGFILEQPNLVARSSIRFTANGASVSEPTVIRFCRAVGCNGFQDLKQRLARDIGRLTPATVRTPSTGIVSKLDRRFDLAFSTLFKLKETPRYDDLADAGRFIATAQSVSIWSGSESGLVDAATDGLSSLGIATIVSRSEASRHADLGRLGAQDALLAIAMGDDRGAILADVERARQGGVRTVSLTVQGNTSDDPWRFDLGEDFEVSASGAVFAEFAGRFVIDLLCVAAAEDAVDE